VLHPMALCSVPWILFDDGVLSKGIEPEEAFP